MKDRIGAGINVLISFSSRTTFSETSDQRGNLQHFSSVCVATGIGLVQLPGKGISITGLSHHKAGLAVICHLLGRCEEIQNLVFMNVDNTKLSVGSIICLSTFAALARVSF